MELNEQVKKRGEGWSVLKREGGGGTGREIDRRTDKAQSRKR